MSDTLFSTLSFPFERGLLDPPTGGERVLLIGARAGFRRPAWLAGALELVQGFRPDHLALQRAGFRVAREAQEDGYGAALLLLGRHRGDNERQLAMALARTRPGALIAAACSKKDGGGSLRRRMEEHLSLDGHASKHHGTVFWLRRPKALDEGTISALEGGSPRADGFATAAGGFSDDGIDPGSALLAGCLPDDLGGRVADFAAGWGYLSVAVARRCRQVSAIDLFEAHHASLEAARGNMATLAPHVEARFFWHDLLGEPVTQRYDAIVMNPPFHRGRAAEPDMGRAMIAVAAGALKRRGRLLLVANRQLPYERTLEDHFPTCGALRRDAAFKVLWGQK